MQSLFRKTRVLVLGNLHMLLDKAIDINSIPVLEQYVRDLETAQNGVMVQAASAKGNVTTIERNIANLRSQVDENQKNIDLLLGDNDPDNDSHAVTIEMQSQGLQSQIKTLEDSLENAKKLASNMDDAVGKIKGKHTEMMSRLNELRQLNQSANATEQAATALDQAASLSGGIDASSSIDNVEARLRARNDVANARLEEAFGGVSGNTDDAVALAKAKDAIAARKAELNKTAVAA